MTRATASSTSPGSPAAGRRCSAGWPPRSGPVGTARPATSPPHLWRRGSERGWRPGSAFLATPHRRSSRRLAGSSGWSRWSRPTPRAVDTCAQAAGAGASSAGARGLASTDGFSSSRSANWSAYRFTVACWACSNGSGFAGRGAGVGGSA